MYKGVCNFINLNMNFIYLNGHIMAALCAYFIAIYINIYIHKYMYVYILCMCIIMFHIEREKKKKKIYSLCRLVNSRGKFICSIK